VRAALELGFEQAGAGRNEVLARTVDVMRGTMDDFITIEEVEYREQVPVPAFKAREAIRASIADAYDKMESAASDSVRQGWQKVINDLETREEGLPDNPAELVTIDGPIRRQTIARIDLEKARRAGKMHLIRKLKSTERGLEVELYSASDARELLGRHHKLWVDRIEHSGEVTQRVVGIEVVKPSDD
jgi:phage terminase small subunit